MLAVTKGRADCTSPLASKLPSTYVVTVPADSREAATVWYAPSHRLVVPTTARQEEPEFSPYSK
eukprot:3830102-Prymnesium_polylepis.1